MPKSIIPPYAAGPDDNWTGGFEVTKVGNVEYQSKEHYTVNVATTGDTALTGLQTIDGQALTKGMRVMVWKQTTATQNGMWRATDSVWIRERRFQIAEPLCFVVATGTSYGKKAFVVVADNTVAQYGSAGGLFAAKAASNANITLSGTQTIDGISCTSGDPVLVISQTNSAENGLYTCNSSAWDLTENFDSSTLYKVYAVFSGTNYGKTFMCSNGSNGVVKMGAYYL